MARLAPRHALDCVASVHAPAVTLLEGERIVSSLSLAGLVFTHWLANRLSIEQASAVGSFIGRRLGTASKRNSRALANISFALPSTTPAERDLIARGMWDNFGRTVAESLLIDRIAEDPGRVVLANPELLDAAQGPGLDPGRGTVFVGLHFGNWEATIIPALRHGQRPIGVYKPLKNAEVNAWLLRHRRHLYPGGLYPASSGTLLRIARHVRAGGAICVLADHRDAAGLAVPFFGRPAPSVALPAMLAVRYGARILAARVDRLPHARFSVTLDEIAVPGSGDQAADTLAATAAIQAKLQDWITTDPGRWLWFYKRWDAAD